MTPAAAGSVLQQMLLLTAMLAAPPLVAGLAIGVAVGVLQSVTQIQESSVMLVPKLLGIGVALLVSGPWCLDKLVGFFHFVLDQMARTGAGGF
jgi:flagellar biosynthesis protein FliQ